MSIELSQQEASKQLRTLTEVRNRQHLHLVQSGVARRILDAEVPITYLKDNSPFTEGTLLYPTRAALAQTAIGLIWGGRASISGSCEKVPQNVGEWFSFMEKYPEADVLSLGRLEATERGYLQTTIITGVQLERDNPETGIFPMDGIEVVDAIELSELLREVEEKHLSGELSCLDPDSLINLTIGRHGPVPLP